MRFLLLLFLIFLSKPLFALNPDGGMRALVPVADLGLEDELVVDASLFNNKKEILDRVLKTLYYLESSEAQELYSINFNKQVRLEAVRKSLHHFYLLLLLSPDADTFTERLKSNFALFKSVGQDGKGTVRFTGYFQPSYSASRRKNKTYRFPIFKKPLKFEVWKKPHPTRIELEGYTGERGVHVDLRGQELAWLKSRFDVFMIQLQGSAILELQDGSKMAVGYAAGTDHPFTGIKGSFLRKHKIAWHRLGEFFEKKPELLNQILARNNRFIFFKENETPAAIGSLGVPVLAERSIATDKLKLPPGALAFIKTRMPQRTAKGTLELVEASRFVLNLDTGSALKGPGRVDIFMGTGEEARIKASSIYNTGQLYYLFLEGS